VFYIESERPLSGARISLYSYTDNPRESKEVRLDVAATGPDGGFKIDCYGIAKVEFPLRIVLSHPDRNGIFLTNLRIDSGDERTGINLPVNTDFLPEKEIPERDVTMSYSLERNGSDNYVVGTVENKTSNHYRCIRAEFFLHPANTVPIDIRNLRPHDRRPYKLKLPYLANHYLKSMSKCK